MLPSLARRYQQGKFKQKKTVLGSTGAAGEYAMAFAGRCNEAFYVICLDSQNQVNQATLLHEGTINEAPVYPRLIVETARCAIRPPASFWPTTTPAAAASPHRLMSR